MGFGTIGSVIDSLEFDTADCDYPHIIHISGNVFAVVYTGVLNDGWVATFTIDTAGAIGAAVIDTLEFDAVGCDYARIINVSGTTYAIAYTVPINSGVKIVTLDIDTAGNIGAAVIDSFTSADTVGFMPRILHVSGDVFAVSYQNDRTPVAAGEVLTVTIDSAGNIGAAEIDTFEFTATAMEEHDFIHISGTMYAIAYTGVDSDGWLCTFTIAANGTIADAVTDTLEFDTADCQSPNIIQVSGSVYAIAYEGVAGDGFVVTVTINTDGTIDNAVIDSLEFDTSQGYSPSIVYISGILYAVAYEGVDGDGFLKTFSIAPDGTISSVLGTLEFDTGDGDEPDLVVVPNTTILAVVYGGVLNDGWVKTAAVNLAGELSGVYAVVQTRWHYVDAYGVERYLEGTIVT